MQITPDKLRFELIINGISTDITDYVSNWEDIKIDYTRDDLKGVYIDISNSIDFIGTAYTMLDNLYTANSFNANAIFIVSLRNDVLDSSLTLWTYSELKRVDLDFSTFKRTDYVISLNAKSNSLADLIKANKGTVYDIPVSELSPSTFNYDRLAIKNSLNISPMVVDPSMQPTDGSGVVLRINRDHSEYGRNMYHLALEDAGNSEMHDSNMVYFNSNNFVVFKANSDAYLSANFKVTKGSGYYFITVGIGVIIGTSMDNSLVVLKQQNVDQYQTINFVYEKSKIGAEIDGTLVLFAFYDQSAPLSFGDSIKFSDININLEYTSRDNPVTFDCISLQSLIDKLLYKIAGSGYTATINTGIANNIRLASAESVRGFANAKFHTSFEQFYNSMRAVFGLEYDISGNTIAFKPRSELFKDTKAIEITDVTDLELSVNTSHIYSSLKIGFKKVDYNKVNGKDEFRFTNEFSSGVTVSSKKLELISDYRADAWGIEFLVQSRGEDTTDDQSDNDVFFLDCATVGSTLVPSRVIPITGVISPTTMFNVIFSPRNCLLRNALYLGVSSDLFIFASSEGLSNISINGIAENSNVSITNKLFLPDILGFKVGEISALPSEKDGYVEFIYKGITYKGYIKELNHFIGKDQETTWKLFRKQ